MVLKRESSVLILSRVVGDWFLSSVMCLGGSVSYFGMCMGWDLGVCGVYVASVCTRIFVFLL